MDSENFKDLIARISESRCSELLSFDREELKELTDDQASLVAKAFSENNNLRSIDFGTLTVSPKGMMEMWDALKNKKTLKTITFLPKPFNGIDNNAVKHLAEDLKSNTTLEELILRNGNINEEGAKYLAEAIKANKTLNRLDLESNPIGAEGAKYLEEAMRVNITLTDLQTDGVGSMEIREHNMHNRRIKPVLDQLDEFRIPEKMDMNFNVEEKLKQFNDVILPGLVNDLDSLYQNAIPVEKIGLAKKEILAVELKLDPNPPTLILSRLGSAAVKGTLEKESLNVKSDLESNNKIRPQ